MGPFSCNLKNQPNKTNYQPRRMNSNALTVTLSLSVHEKLTSDKEASLMIMIKEITFVVI